jgi:cation-transporting P-type ATPase I
MASATGTRRRAATVALIGLVCTQLAQTLVDSHGRLVVMTTVGSVAVLAGVITTPGLSHVFGCTPVGPFAWGQALLATAVAGLVSALAPNLLVPASEAVRRWIIHVGANSEESVSTTTMPARMRTAGLLPAPTSRHRHDAPNADCRP